MKSLSVPPASISYRSNSPKSPNCPISPQISKSPLKPLILLTSLICAFTLSCSDIGTDPRPATILVTVTGECVCNIFLYTPEGLCLQSKIYNCNEIRRLSFTLYYQGELTVIAEYRDKVVTLPITTTYNKTTEADIIF